MNILHKTLVLALGLAAHTGSFAQEGRDPAANLTLEDLRTFTEVFNQVRNHYVEELDERVLLRAAIEGMVTQLDPWSEFMDAEQFRNFDNSSEGRYGGIGVRVEVRERRIFIDAVLPDSPAQRAGILAGDMLLAIDGQAIRGRRLNESVDALLGEPGTEISLRLQTPGQAARELALERAYVPVPSVFRKLVDQDVGTFHISHFTRHSHEELQEGIDDLQARLGRPLTGIILDLRGNPGGMVSPAVEIADGFLDKGLIVYTRSRYAPTRIEISARQGQWISETPLVVLVDEQTASAAEVLAGALQDNDRATIIGSRTFGKGSIQSVLALRNGSALKLTTARYFTPSGRVIEEQGIEPDLVLPPAPDSDQTVPSAELEPGLEAALRTIRGLQGDS